MGIEYILDFFKMFVLVSFVMFITRGIMKEKHMRLKGIVYLVVSSVLCVAGLIALVVDINYWLYNEDMFLYIFFSASALIYVCYAISIIIKSKKFGGPVKNKVVFTLREKIEHIYILYKYEGSFYVLKNTNTGVSYKMKKTEFSDDVVSKLNNKYIGNNNLDVDKLGNVTTKTENIDNVYYCYVINVESPLNEEVFTELDNLNVNNMDISGLDKYIIIKCLIGASFDDEY